MLSILLLSLFSADTAIVNPADTFHLLRLDARGYALVRIENGREVTRTQLGIAAEYGVSEEVIATMGGQSCNRCWRLRVIDRSNDQQLFEMDLEIELLRNLQGPSGRLFHLPGTSEIYFTAFSSDQDGLVLLHQINYQTGESKTFDVPRSMGHPNLFHYADSVGVYNGRDGSLLLLDRVGGAFQYMVTNSTETRQSSNAQQYFYHRESGLFRLEPDRTMGKNTVSESFLVDDIAFGKRVVVNGYHLGRVAVHPSQKQFMVGVLDQGRNLTRVLRISMDKGGVAEYSVPFPTFDYVMDPTFRFIKCINYQSGAVVIFDTETGLYRDTYQLGKDYLRRVSLIPET